MRGLAAEKGGIGFEGLPGRGLGNGPRQGAGDLEQINILCTCLKRDRLGDMMKAYSLDLRQRVLKAEVRVRKAQ